MLLTDDLKRLEVVEEEEEEELEQVQKRAVSSAGPRSVLRS